MDSDLLPTSAERKWKIGFSTYPFFIGAHLYVSARDKLFSQTPTWLLKLLLPMLHLRVALQQRTPF